MVAGVNIAIDSNKRYSRVHSAYDKMTCDRNEIGTTKSFALSLVAPDFGARWNQIQNQFKTLDIVNTRTCCTNNWVRSFDRNNGGGNAFNKTKMQRIDKSMFKSISWTGNTGTSIVTAAITDPFLCDSVNFSNASCEIKSLTPSEEENYLTWAGSLELIGIPQVAIKTNDQVFKLVTQDTQTTLLTKDPLSTDSTNVIEPVTNLNADFFDGTNRYYSGTNYTNLRVSSAGLKKVFSEDEFNCCLPSGQELPATTNNAQCCTGLAVTIDSAKRCCLPDFTDVTVYLNRYVSSEGKGLPDSAYSPVTGYIKDPGQVQLMVSQKNLCCSGEAMTGVAISQLPIPIKDASGNPSYLPPDSSNTTRRFTYMDNSVDNAPETGGVQSLFDAGVRWNNHVYCVPEGFNQGN
jgi:hypothetical protein